MDYGEYIGGVADRASVPYEQAEVITRATLQTLADRISGGESEDVAALLPEALREPLRRPREKDPEKFELDEFVRRVGERAGVDAATAREGARAVFTTLRRTVGGEFEDVAPQLPREFGELLKVTTT